MQAGCPRISNSISYLSQMPRPSLSKTASILVFGFGELSGLLFCCLEVPELLVSSAGFEHCHILLLCISVYLLSWSEKRSQYIAAGAYRRRRDQGIRCHKRSNCS